MKANESMQAAPASATTPSTAIDPALLQQLIQGAQTTSSTTGTARPARRTKVSGVYRRATRIVALLGVLALSAGIWWAGAYFTLQWLHSTRISSLLTSLGIWAWGIPVGVTAIELALNPRKEREPLLVAAWLAILLFDVGTTAAGVQLVYHIDTTALLIPLFGTIGIIGAIAGVLLAYSPEKLATRSAVSLWEEMTR